MDSRLSSSCKLIHCGATCSPRLLVGGVEGGWGRWVCGLGHSAAPSAVSEGLRVCFCSRSSSFLWSFSCLSRLLRAFSTSTFRSFTFFLIKARSWEDDTPRACNTHTHTHGMKKHTHTRHEETHSCKRPHTHTHPHMLTLSSALPSCSSRSPSTFVAVNCGIWCSRLRPRSQWATC